MRQNPHVRICGGPGSATTLVYPTTFRAYVVAYLRNHPMIHQEMTFLVRHLAPTEHGLPIEIYVFSRDQVWSNYEGIQADIFDHILAIAPAFDLRVYQSPTGGDVREALSR